MVDIEEIESLATSDQNEIEERVKALIYLKKGNYDTVYIHHSYLDDYDVVLEVYSVNVDNKEIAVYLSRVSDHMLRNVERSVMERVQDIDNHQLNRVADKDNRYTDPGDELIYADYEKSLAVSKLMKQLIDEPNPELRDLETYLTTYSI